MYWLLKCAVLVSVLQLYSTGKWFVLNISNVCCSFFLLHWVVSLILGRGVSCGRNLLLSTGFVAFTGVLRKILT